VAPDAIAAHEIVAAWREAYGAMGVKASKFRSSIEALLRRGSRLLDKALAQGGPLRFAHPVPRCARANPKAARNPCRRCRPPALHPFLAVADAQDHVGREFVEVQQLLVAEFGRRILQQRAETPACPSC